MNTGPIAVGLGLLGGLVAGAIGRKVGRKLLPPVETDVDFRRLPERRDVIAGWETRPHVPGTRTDEVH